MPTPTKMLGPLAATRLLDPLAAGGVFVPFSPAAVPNLAFWIRADREVYANPDGSGVVADGGLVGHWGDTVGGYDLTQEDEGLRPTLVAASAYHGQPAVNFPGVDEFLENAAFQLTSGRTAATWLLALVAATDRYDYPLMSVPAHVLCAGVTGGRPVWYHNTNSGEYRLVPDGTYLGKPVLLLYGFDASGGTNDERLFARVNAERYPVARGGSNINTTAHIVVPGFKLGKHATSASVGKFHLLEAAFWPRVLTPAELAELESYAAERYFSTAIQRVVAVGDSLTEGYPITLTNPWFKLLDELYGAEMVATGKGTRAYTILLLEPTARSLGLAAIDGWHTKNVFIHQGGTNDLDPGMADRTAAQAIADMSASVANRQSVGWTTLVCTIPIRGDLIGEAATTFEARRTEYNAAVRDGTIGADGVVDWALAPELQDPFNETYFYIDRLHFSLAGNAVLAELAKTQIDAVAAR